MQKEENPLGCGNAKGEGESEKFDEDLLPKGLRPRLKLDQTYPLQDLHFAKQVHGGKWGNRWSSSKCKGLWVIYQL